MPHDLPPDFIWIQDAAEKYGRSLPWLYKQIKEGKLAAKEIAGDARTYLIESQLVDLLRPQDRIIGQQYQREE